MTQILDFMEKYQNVAWMLCMLVLGIIVGMALAEAIPFVTEALRPMPPSLPGVVA